MAAGENREAFISFCTTHTNKLPYNRSS